MKPSHFLLAFLAVLPLGATAQHEQDAKSTIADAKVYLQGAELTRVAEVSLRPGKNYVRFVGLSVNIDEASLQLKGKGRFTIMGLSTEQDYISEQDLPRDLQVLKDSLDHYTRMELLLNKEKDLLSAEENLLNSNKSIGGEQQGVVVEELQKMATFYRERMLAIADRRFAIDREMTRVRTRKYAFQRQYQQELGAARKSINVVVAELDAAAATQAKLTLTYFLNGASWSPIYALRVDEVGAPVQTEMKALVRQTTGVDWDNVALSLSTANPTRSGELPDLGTSYVKIYQPVSYERSLGSARRMQAAPAPAAEIADAEFAEEATAEPDDYSYQAEKIQVQAVSTSLAREFRISEPYSLPGNGEDVSVDLEQYAMEANFAHATVPKLDQTAYLIAKVSEWEQYDLLPGQASIFFEAGFVGQTYLNPQAIDDIMEISLGPNPGVVVERKEVSDYSSRRTIGSNIRETKEYQITVRNAGNKAIEIKVEDSYPLSQDSRIEIELSEGHGAEVNDRTGKLTWDLEIAPGQSKTLKFSYEVKYPKGESLQYY